MGKSVPLLGLSNPLFKSGQSAVPENHQEFLFPSLDHSPDWEKAKYA